MGIKNKARSFTLVEVVAVLAIIAATMAIALGSFRFFSKDVKQATQRLTKKIQATYYQAIKESKVYRLSFEPESSVFRVEVLELENKVPPKEDEEAYQAWEDEQEEKQRRLSELSPDERKKLSQLDRSQFRILREEELGKNMQILKILKSGQPDQSFLAEDKLELKKDENFLIFYPSGEMDSALIVLSDLSNEVYSLVTNPLTGRVKVKKGELSEAEWQKLNSE